MNYKVCTSTHLYLGLYLEPNVMLKPMLNCNPKRPVGTKYFGSYFVKGISAPTKTLKPAP